MVRYGNGSGWLFMQDSGKGQCSNAYFNYWGPTPITECQVFVPSVATSPAAMPGGGPAIDLAKFPLANPGFSDDRVRPTAEIAPLGSDGTGSFRDGCNFSHLAFDDPLVAPGQPGASHLHMFFGNTGTNAYSTVSTLASTGLSSCNGGTINRSAYWVPAMIDTLDGTPLAPLYGTFYYKSGYNGIKPSDIRPFPAGLRMLAGNSKGSTADAAAGTYSCENASTAAPAPGPGIINCPLGSELRMNIAFPQCWDGVNLDSPDHKSHMSFTVSNKCPSTHPVPLPEISYHVVYAVKEANAPLRWRLASDAYSASAPGGYSAHADWMNGWKPDIMNAWVKNCVVAARDCHSHLLGDGREFYGY